MVKLRKRVSKFAPKICVALARNSTSMFAVAANITTSCSLGRQYWPVLSLFFLDVYAKIKREKLSMLRMIN
jgi:hypothetical protein